MGTKTKKSPPRHRLKRWLLGTAGVIVVLILAGYVAFQVSPWPGSMAIRYLFDKGGLQTAEKLGKYVPSGIASTLDQQYRPNDDDAQLDVYYPQSVAHTDKTLPTIVWIHGGAWVSGNKSDVGNYLKILSSHGYTTVSVNYSIAPEKHYPTPVVQTNAALRYLNSNAARLHIDTNKFVLAGDSAGSQIAAQVGAIISNQDYAKDMKMAAPLQVSQLKGMLLNCGAYDLDLIQKDKAAKAFVDTVLWAYTGKKDYSNDPGLELASVVQYVNSSYPASFITAGNADPLEPQSRELAKKLTALGVPIDALFYPEDHQPKLPHEYQFNLDLEDGKQALGHMLRFLEIHAK